MKKSLKNLPYILLTILSIVACSPQPNPPTTNQTDTLKLLYWQAPTILNPHLSNGYKDAEASRITLEPLASYDNNGQLIPFLAAEIPTRENGGIAEDGKSVTWKLKQNIKWSDGTPFTAADVVFTYQFISNPNVGANTTATYNIISSVEAIDDYTVKVNFKDVTPGWNLVFIGTQGMILPRHKFSEYNGANSRQAPANLMPVGTGAYRVVEFKPGDTIVYEPNPEYWQSNQPHFQRIELKGGGDATSAARAVLQTGDADFAYNLQVEAPILQQLEATGKGQVVGIFGPQVERIHLNLSDPKQGSSVEFTHPFFTNPQVRQAFNLVVDRETIGDRLYGDTGKPTANLLVAPQQFNSPNTKYEFNLEKAAVLLDEAGWEDSNGNGIRDKNGVEMTVLFQTSVNPLRQKTQEIVKQALESIGVGVELKSIDASIFFGGDPANTDTTGRFAADLEMFTTGNTSPDPGAYMKYYTCDTIPDRSNNWSGDNVSRYCNPKYDQLWQQSTNELDPQKRQQLLIQMNDMLVEEVIAIPVVARAEVVGVSNSIVGVELTSWDLRTWNIAEWKRE
ncbi:MAG: peptide ABC transporter substrate-binding protein [Microcoleaceae cyanobacterium MO_207.B10]|nr:peptide ABC transporter substrate-binding protein [Microcoleaceae cyanobacterium MO_207.B10]